MSLNLTSVFEEQNKSKGKGKKKTSHDWVIEAVQVASADSLPLYRKGDILVKASDKAAGVEGKVYVLFAASLGTAACRYLISKLAGKAPVKPAKASTEIVMEGEAF